MTPTFPSRVTYIFIITILSNGKTPDRWDTDGVDWWVKEN